MTHRRLRLARAGILTEIDALISGVAWLDENENGGKLKMSENNVGTVLQDMNDKITELTIKVEKVLATNEERCPARLDAINKLREDVNTCFSRLRMVEESNTGTMTRLTADILALNKLVQSGHESISLLSQAVQKIEKSMDSHQKLLDKLVWYLAMAMGGAVVIQFVLSKMVIA